LIKVRSEYPNDPIDSKDKEVVDDISLHLKEAGDFDRAALIPGMYLAWCARLNLLAPEFAKAQAASLLRLHYNDGSCIELLVTGCGGTLRYSDLNERGKDFTRRYYPRYFADWQAVFGADIYAVADSWESYHKIAGVLTEALLGAPKGEARAPGGAWWKFWKK
jgi:hypothetical protein